VRCSGHLGFGELIDGLRSDFLDPEEPRFGPLEALLGAANDPCKNPSFLRLLCTPRARLGGAPTPLRADAPPVASRGFSRPRTGPGPGRPGRARTSLPLAQKGRVRLGRSPGHKGNNGALRAGEAANGPYGRLSFLRLFCTPGRAGEAGRDALPSDRFLDNRWRPR
jgi:hypothetical protein